MTKEDILKLYIADLNNLVADSDAKRSRIIDLEDELEALKKGQTLPIDSVIVPKGTLVCEHPLDKRASFKSHGKDFCWKCGEHITN